MDEHALRDHLLALLWGREAHLTFENVVADFPPEFIEAIAGYFRL